MDDKISIIIPVYNAEKYLRKCLDSVMNQTYNNLQIILIDDGSVDQSGIICDEYASKDSRFEVYHQPNSGQASARNSGLSHANGDWIGFVDNDDIIELNMYERLLRNAKNNCVYVSGCATNTVYESGESVNKFSDIESGIKEGDDLVLDMLYQMGQAWGALWNKIFYKSLKEKLKFPEGYQLEDYWVSIRLYHEVGKIYFDHEPLYRWYSRSTSQSHKKIGEDKLTIFEMSEKINNYCTEIKELKNGGCYFAFISHVNLIWNILKYDIEDKYRAIAKEKTYRAYELFFKLKWHDDRINKKLLAKNLLMLFVSSVKLLH